MFTNNFDPVAFEYSFIRNKMVFASLYIWDCIWVVFIVKKY